MLASLVHVIPATHAALHKCNHPIGFLVSPPQDLPAKGLEGAMAAFVTAGKALRPDSDYKLVVNTAFQEHAAMPEDSGQRWTLPGSQELCARHASRLRRLEIFAPPSAPTSAL